MTEILMHYTGQLRLVAKTGDEKFVLSDGATLQTLVAAICERHGSAMSDQLLDKTGALLNFVVFLIDSRAHTDLGSVLPDDSVVNVLGLTPALGG